jgi:hypothetical protein
MVTHLASKICFSGIIHLSLSSKTIKSNTQDPGFHSVALHHINLKSEFVSGEVVVGVRPTPPVEDMSLLFGIDMAGKKVNDHLLHGDGDRSHYFIDKEQQSCLNTDED